MRRLCCSALAAGLTCSMTLHAGRATTSDTRAGVPPAIEALALPAGATTIQIDGELSEEAWTKAPVVSEFLQREPSEGMAATHQTEVRVLFDTTALYVGIRAEEPDS